jgi:hypothetical protein
MHGSILNICNTKIKEVKKTFDYWQLYTDEFTLNIYNPVKLFTTQEYSTNLEDIINHLIVNIDVKDGEFFILELDNNKRIYVSLKYDDFVGPEAIEIWFKTGEIIVFN